jgi:hypothetical protein
MCFLPQQGGVGLMVGMMNQARIVHHVRVDVVERKQGQRCSPGACTQVVDNWVGRGVCACN